MKKIKVKIKSLVNKFFSKEGEKIVISYKPVMILILGLTTVLVVPITLLKNYKDNSSVEYSQEGVHQEQKEQPNNDSKGLLDKLFGKNKEHNNNKGGAINLRATVRQKNINYKAKQVINRKGDYKLRKGVPMGTHLIGKLLTTIDSRETGQMYKVILPYGGKTRQSPEIPKNTILFGQATYPGKGRKVFIQFIKALLPNGKEVKISAQALSSKDYSPGLIGQFKGRRTERIVSTIGLTMVSAMTNTLTEKQALGEGQVVTEKSNLKNAIYQGVSKVSEMEAGRQASELNQSPEYVSVQAGKEMIINLLSVFHIE